MQPHVQRLYSRELFGCSPLLWAVYRYALDNQTSARESIHYDSSRMEEGKFYTELAPKWMAAVFGSAEEDVCAAIQELHAKGVVRPVVPERAYGSVGLYEVPSGLEYQADRHSQALRAYRKEAQQRRRAKSKSQKKAS